ncbi:MAG: diaminobutyrate--2-oxoglutarate transaminase [Spirochaetia bacterium]|nr:diaminobutyrate--2-oxoglutarate transaminase [Spirochaetia bacterium]
MRIIEKLESDVRSYVRSFPAVFDTAKGALLFDKNKKKYIDFFAGAGTLNYGHNNPKINEAIIKYLERNGIVHGLDKATVAKIDFLQKFQDTILKPRNLDYKVQFTGPTGTNAVETALKLVRLIKKRSNIISFTNGYHGLTMGALSTTGNNFYRDEAYGVRLNTDFMPYDGYFGQDINTIEYFRKFLTDNSSGVDLPAGVIVETIQGEGGINVASIEWLKQLETLCREFDILLIIDDIQVGNGRTGNFFSFERAKITPDLITLSKSIGGGLPMALLLMRPELDQWQPGEHTGTFRGNNLAFIAASEALTYWDNDDFSEAISYKSKIIKEELEKICEKYTDIEMNVRGIGMIWGLEFKQIGMASEISKNAFEKGLVIETAGSNGEVIKFLPPLIIDEELLREGLMLIDKVIASYMKNRKKLITGGVFDGGKN